VAVLAGSVILALTELLAVQAVAVLWELIAETQPQVEQQIKDRQAEQLVMVMLAVAVFVKVLLLWQVAVEVLEWLEPTQLQVKVALVAMD
jgi:hypothetical protein